METTNPHLEFGLQPPSNAVAAWGARAIYKPENRSMPIDLLRDRQSVYGPKEAVAIITRSVNAFLAKLPSPYPRLMFGDPESVKETSFDLDNGVTLQTCPNASGGYLYIVAWIKRDEPEINFEEAAAQARTESGLIAEIDPPDYERRYDEPPNMEGDPCYCASCDKYLGEGSNPGELCITCRGEEEE